MQSNLRIIGDCHGYLKKLMKIAGDAKYAICLGDIGFKYQELTKMSPERLMCLGGNHDNYTKNNCQCKNKEECKVCLGKGYVYGKQTKHFLNDYGELHLPGFESIFYIRGAWSIDWEWRMPGVSWWEDEEIPERQMRDAIESYKKIKPEFVLSHTAPASIIPSVPFERIFGNEIRQTRTEIALDEMYQYHQPKVWLFGHWHVNYDAVIEYSGKKTNFICLNELNYKDFPLNDQ